MPGALGTWKAPPESQHRQIRARGGQMNIVTQTASYGSDEAGLVCGYVFSPGASGRPVAISGSECVAARCFEQGRARVHMVPLQRGSHRRSREMAQGTCRVCPTPLFEALREGSRSTQIEQARRGTLVAVLKNDVIYDFASAESSQVSTLWLSVDQRRLISVRRQPLRSLDRLRTAVRAGNRFHRPSRCSSISYTIRQKY